MLWGATVVKALSKYVDEIEPRKGLEKWCNTLLFPDENDRESEYLGLFDNIKKQELNNANKIKWKIDGSFNEGKI